MSWSAPITSAAPAIEPIDLETAKTFLRIDGNDQDSDVDLYRIGARDHVERVTGTRLITQTVDLNADTFADLTHLPLGPVQSVTSVSYRDASGAIVALDPGAYELFGADLERGIRPAGAAKWPSIGAFAGAVSVRLVVGYGPAATAIPPAVLLATYRVLRGLAEEREVDIAAAVVNHRIWLA